MKPLSFDTETALFRPGMMAPELSCVTWQLLGEAAGIEHVDAVYGRLKNMLEDEELLLIGHNVAYDFGVICNAFPDLLPLVFAAYDANRVQDTMIRQKLIDIGQGYYRRPRPHKGKMVKWSYSLADCAKRLLDLYLEKDEWRLCYGELRELPLAEWPVGARTYPLDDARSTLAVFLKQQEHRQFLADSYSQARAAWWLHLTSVWGARTRREGTLELEEHTETAYAKVEKICTGLGLVKPNGQRDTKAAKALMIQICKEQNIKLRRTNPTARCPEGDIQLDEDACKATHDERLIAYAELSTLKAVLTKDLPMLAKASSFPVHTRYDLAETGRVTSSGPNLNNIRRLPGIRECFVPREGYVFAQADYDGLELRTLSQVCLKLLGFSKLAEALNSGLDPHTAFACSLLGISYEEGARRKEDETDCEFDSARQTAKVANFGFPGGLGAESLCVFAKKTYNVDLTIERAKQLKAAWLEQWPEMMAYFAYVNNLPEHSEGRIVKQLFSNRIRGGCTYTAACNSFFQGLGADATKRAGWLIAKACYVDTTSPLYGCRIIFYIYDEFILEVPDDHRAHDAAHELARLMVVGANELLPDVPAKTKPVLMRYWSKKAKAVKDLTGRLIPWAA